MAQPPLDSRNPLARSAGTDKWLLCDKRLSPSLVDTAYILSRFIWACDTVHDGCSSGNGQALASALLDKSFLSYGIGYGAGLYCLPCGPKIFRLSIVRLCCENKLRAASHAHAKGAAPWSVMGRKPTLAWLVAEPGWECSVLARRFDGLPNAAINAVVMSCSVCPNSALASAASRISLADLGPECRGTERERSARRGRAAPPSCMSR